jgi:hypothetical protein
LLLQEQRDKTNASVEGQQSFGKIKKVEALRNELFWPIFLLKKKDQKQMKVRPSVRKCAIVV